MIVQVEALIPSLSLWRLGTLLEQLEEKKGGISGNRYKCCYRWLKTREPALAEDMCRDP